MQQSFEQYLASAIMHGTRKHFSSLHADYLEQYMSEQQLNANDGAVKVNRAQGSPADGKSQGSNDSNGSSVTSGMRCASPVPVSIPAIQRGKDTLTRSVGDVARASLDKAADNGGPRSSVGQFPLSGRTPAASAPQSFIGAEGSDQN
jgi:hypothetical protein